MDDTKQIDVPQDQWKDITDNSLEGLVTNNSEHSIRYRVSSVVPDNEDNFGHILHPQKDVYFNLKSDQRFYAKAFSHGSFIALTKNHKVPVFTKSLTTFEVGPTLDAAGRLKTSEPFGVLDNKNISTRNKNQWNEVLSGVILVYTNKVGTGFNIGNQIRGTLPVQSIPAGIVTDDNGTRLRITCNRNDFQVGDTITQVGGAGNGTTAVLVSVDTGSNITHNYNHAAVDIKVGTEAGDYAFRESLLTAAYLPGKGQNPSFTFVPGERKQNVIQRIGPFTNTDGPFLEISENDIEFVVRTSTSGTPSDANRFPQSIWNIDRLDGGLSGGPNPSGITLDLTKAQFTAYPFLWQGLGPVYFGLNVGNREIYVHEIETANVGTLPYMRTPTLPLRYEIRNIGSTTSPTILKEICSSITSEGGYSLPGLEFTVDDGYVPRTVTTAFTPILAIRLKSQFPNGRINKRFARFLGLEIEAETNDAFIRLLHVHDPLDVDGTWISSNDDSAIEYSLDLTSFIGRPSHKVLAFPVNTAAANKGASRSVDAGFISLHSYIGQNYNSTNSSMFVAMARSKTGNANIYRSLTYIEFE